MLNQDNVFLNGEGDNWYTRNKSGLGKNSVHTFRLMELYDLHPDRVLEIGCSSGYLVDEIVKKYGAKGCGIEVSAKAVKAAHKAYPHLDIRRTLASDIPFKNNSFDLLISSFVLHWVDRTTLLRTIAEMNRVVKPGGHIIIGDFYPHGATVNPYHHKKGLHTYKMNYGALFEATGMYTLLCHLTINHENSKLQMANDHDRAAYQLLVKNEITAV